MKIAIISPTKYLEEFSNHVDDKYHMVLAHRYLSDPAYRDFYNKEKEKGAEIILDNGACELKESIRSEDLLTAIKGLSPDYLVVPDVLDDSERTIKRSTDFIKQYSDIKSEYELKYIAVPQGKTADEWLRSFEVFSEDPEVDVMGISSVKALNSSNLTQFDRDDAIEILASKGYELNKKGVHILGLGDSGHMEVKKLKRHSFIEGVDTSAPVVHGYYGVQFVDGEEYTKIPKYLPDDLKNIEKLQRENILQNIEVLYDAARI